MISYHLWQERFGGDLDVLGRTLQLDNVPVEIVGAMLLPIRDSYVGQSRSLFLMVLGGVGLLLLMAAANVANLQLVRAIERRRETALQYALGAGRGAVARRMIVESVLLALVGGAGGVILACSPPWPWGCSSVSCPQCRLRRRRRPPCSGRAPAGPREECRAAALTVAAVGIYGVLAFVVRGRRREIAIRSALGAQPGSILQLVVGQGLRLVGIGLAIGVGGALLTGRLASSFLFGVDGLNGAVLGVTALALLTVAALASYLPARQVTRIDPNGALADE